MSGEFTPAWSGVFAQLEQPVLFVRDEQVIWRNPAADRLLCGAAPVLAECLLPETLAAYRAFDGNGTLALMLRLGSSVRTMTVTRERETDVFVAAPVTECAAAAGAGTAVVLRRVLSELFDAVDSMPGEVYGDPDARRSAARLQKGLYQLAHLSEHLADLGRLESGSWSADFQRTELVELLSGLCGRAGPLCKACGVTLRFASAERVMSAPVDRTLLECAALELIANALGRTSRGGEIELRLERSVDRAVISVSDDGEAPPALMRELDAGGPAASPLDDPRRGDGMGLSIACHIARLHGGTLMARLLPERGAVLQLSFSLLLLRSAPDELDTALRTPGLSLNRELLSLADALPTEVFLDLIDEP